MFLIDHSIELRASQKSRMGGGLGNAGPVVGALAAALAVRLLALSRKRKKFAEEEEEEEEALKSAEEGGDEQAHVSSSMVGSVKPVDLQWHHLFCSLSDKSGKHVCALLSLFASCTQKTFYYMCHCSQSTCSMLFKVSVLLKS